MATAQKNTRSKSTKKPQDRKIAITGERDSIDVTLVGRKYVINPPKTVVMLEFMSLIKEVEGSPEKVLEVIERYVEAAFSKEGAASVMKRLHDPSDNLDLQHITQLITEVMEITTGNPTT